MVSKRITRNCVGFIVRRRFVKAHFLAEGNCPPLETHITKSEGTSTAVRNCNSITSTVRTRRIGRKFARWRLTPKHQEETQKKISSCSPSCCGGGGLRALAQIGNPVSAHRPMPPNAVTRRFLGASGGGVLGIEHPRLVRGVNSDF